LPSIGHIGRYALKYRIGSGGAGTVYAAHDPLLSRAIAIKTLNLDMSAEAKAAFAPVFLHEARAAAALSHPNIVTVFDAGVSDDSAYIAMELLKGRDLRQLLQERWRPTPQQAALIVRRVADALAYAHAKGVVHRDIKPANIFMVGRAHPRVLDFGIAQVAHRHDGPAGATAVALATGGSPYYMAPEQVRQQPVDRRCDVFSLGVVLYELLTGRRPFTGGNLGEITTAVCEHEPPRADTVDAAVPRALADVAARAMAKQPADRYRSARALSRELRYWLDAQDTQDDRADAAAAPAASGRRPVALALTAAAALALTVGVGALWMRQTPPVPPSAAASTAAPTAPTLAAPAGDTRSAAGTTSGAAPVPGAARPQATPLAAVTAAATATPRPAAGNTAQGKPAGKAPARTARNATRADGPAATAAAAPAAPAAPAPTGTVVVAVSPWGQVEVDGTPAGVAPPLSQLTLAEGEHTIVVRNADFAPHRVTVQVQAGQSVTVRHRFGP
jgi:serine/threonine-protein kinase